MQRYLTHHLLRLLVSLALVAAAPMVHAAELGDVAARSYIGQPLSADVELLAGDGGPVQARLAQPDVYRGASIAMNPALGSVKMAVVRREGKDVLHVTTAGAVNADYVHVYVELTAGGRRDIRLATVWLQPDPNPAPPPARDTPVAAPAAVAAAVAAPEAARVADNAAPAAAAATRPARDRLRPAPLPSVQESPSGATGVGALKAAAAPAKPAALVPVRDIPERISAALGSTLIASARAAEKPEPKLVDQVADKPVAKAAPQAVDKLAGKPDNKSAARPETAAGKPGAVASKSASVATKPEAIAARPDTAAPKPGTVAGKTDVVAAKPETGASKPEVANHKPRAAASKFDTVATGSEAVTSQAAAAPPLPVAQALLPMPPLPLPAGVKKNASGAACEPTGGARACQALDAQSQALAAKLVELEGKMKSLQVALAGSAGGAAAAQVAKAAAPAGLPAARAAPAAAEKPLTIASGMGEARAATLAVQPDAPGTPNQSTPAKQSTPANQSTTAKQSSSAAESVSASASAPATATAQETAPAPEAAPVPQRRVLPKLKYKKEKPPEEPSSKLPLVIGGVVAALLAGAGVLFYLRRKQSGAPLKIWQGFRRKQGQTEAAGDEFREVPMPKSSIPEAAVAP